MESGAISCVNLRQSHSKAPTPTSEQRDPSQTSQLNIEWGLVVPHIVPSNDLYLARRIHTLLNARMADSFPTWSLTPDGRGLQKTLYFKGFKQTIEFMLDLAQAIITQKFRKAKVGLNQKHHPEWSNVYNRVDLIWTTHDSKAITKSDLVMAQLTDKCALWHGGYESEASGKQEKWKPQKPHNEPKLRKSWHKQVISSINEPSADAAGEVNAVGQAEEPGNYSQPDSKEVTADAAGEESGDSRHHSQAGHETVTAETRHFESAEDRRTEDVIKACPVQDHGRREMNS